MIMTKMSSAHSAGEGSSGRGRGTCRLSQLVPMTAPPTMGASTSSGIQLLPSGRIQASAAPSAT